MTKLNTRIDPIDLAVGQRMRIRRKQLGLSQSALAESLGVSFQQVQKYERGANRVSASTLVRVARTLQTSVSELVGEGHGGTADAGLVARLAVPGGLDLLEAFAGITSPAARTAVLRLVRVMVD